MAANTAPPAHPDRRRRSRAPSRLGGLLNDAGYAVDQAADGREALRRLDGGAFDIVLLDIGLPDLSGFDVLTHARRWHRHRSSS
jgi:DNA-binding response OmpR family regulator